MNKRQRKKAKDWKGTILKLSLKEIEASKLTDDELCKIMRKKWEDVHKRLIDEGLMLALNDGSNKHDDR